MVAVVVAAGCDCEAGMITDLRDLQIFMEPRVRVGTGQCLGNPLALGSQRDLARELKEFQRHTAAL